MIDVDAMREEETKHDKRVVIDNIRVQGILECEEKRTRY